MMMKENQISPIASINDTDSEKEDDDDDIYTTFENLNQESIYMGLKNLELKKKVSSLEKEKEALKNELQSSRNIF